MADGPEGYNPIGLPWTVPGGTAGDVAMQRGSGAPAPSVAPQSRNEAFGQGAQPLTATSQQQNIAPGYKPGSIQDQMHLAPNGVDAAGADRMLAGGGSLPAPNAESLSTYSERRPLISTKMNF